ncbi:MAG TPA: hypothetical protein VMF31_00585 [Solirubrobacterales bacterium]|nr:hypothetical protein [Solirubrobacterales bacterium]
MRKEFRMREMALPLVVAFGISGFSTFGLASPSSALESIPVPAEESPTASQLQSTETTNSAAVPDTSLPDVAFTPSELFVSKFSQYLAQPLIDLEDLSVRGSESSYISPNAVLVRSEDDPSQNVIVESTIPFQRKDGRDMDLSLVEKDDGFVPRKPITAVSLPDAADGPVELTGTGIQMLFDGASTTSQAEVVRAPAAMTDEQSTSEAEPTDDDLAFYESSYTDTDIAIAPRPGGIQTFAQLRSPDSPRSFGYALQMPDEWELASSQDGGAAILDADGTPVANVSPAAAIDAVGRNIPVALNVVGDTIKMTLSFDEGEVNYPIMLDPVIDWWNWWTGNNSNFEGWVPSQVGNGSFGLSTYCNAAIFDSCGASGIGTGRGLHTNAQPSRTYTANSQARWEYTVPGSDSYIEEATVWSWRYHKGSHSSNHPFGFFGLRNPSAWTNLFWTEESGGGGGAGVPMSGGTTSKAFSTGLSTHSNVNIPSGSSNWRYMRLAAVNLSLNDATNPYIYTLDTSSIPTGWSSSTSNLSLAFSGWDLGLGIKGVRLSGPGRNGEAYMSEWEEGCTGLAASPCPTSVNALTHPSRDKLSLDLGKVSDGLTTLKVAAVDPLGKRSAERTMTTKLDREGPVTVLSGSLWKARESKVGSGQLPLTIKAYDGSSGDPRSGVKSIAVEVDGNPDPSSTVQTCAAGSCSAERTFILDTGGLTNGSHTMKVTTADQVGNSTERTFSIIVDGTSSCLGPNQQDPACPDSPGGGVFSSVFDGSPSAGGSFLFAEIVDPATGNSRTVDAEGGTTTRGKLGSVATVVRTASPDTEVPGSFFFSQMVDLTPDNDSIDYIANTLRPQFESLGTNVGLTPIETVLRNWQEAPPNHGSHAVSWVELGEPNTEEIADIWWVDSETSLPLRHANVYLGEAGQEVSNRFFTYQPNLIDLSTASSDLFFMDPPANMNGGGVVQPNPEAWKDPGSVDVLYEY